MAVELEEPAPETVPDEYTLEKALGQQNITHYFDDQELTELAMVCMREFEIDDSNFASRRDRIEDLYKLALQAIEIRNYPFDGAASVKYPVLTNAAIGFASLAYPSVVENDRVVKGKVVGNDEGEEEMVGADGEPLVDQETGKVMRKNAGEKQRSADRVSKYMSHEILEEMDGWEEDMDKILHIIPIVGCAFKKTYRDASENKNVSKLVLPQYLIININASGVESAHRASEITEYYPHEIEENIRQGIFREFDYGASTETQKDTYQDSDEEENAVGAQDEDRPHIFIEQHCRRDLDGDGYPEPYIVFIHKDSNQVARILPRFQKEDIIREGGKLIRIKPECYYEKFGFIPDPEGSPYDIGFGHLVQHLNIAANTSINQMLDQGHVYTMGGGFIGAGLRVKSGNLRFRPNEWKRVNTGGMSVRESIVPLPTKEPSAVLLALLELLLKGAEQMTSMSKLMAGDLPANMPVGTALAGLEQALQPFKAVFRRVHRSLKKEFKRLYRLNQMYLTQEEYQRILDDQEADIERDFNSDVADVLPISDPEVITNLQSLMRAQALLEMKDDPLLDGVELRKRALKTMSIEGYDDLVKIPPESVDEVMEAQKAALQAQVAHLQSQIQSGAQDQKRKDVELGIKIEETFVKMKKMQADAIRSLAQAEGEEQGQQLDIYRAHLDHLTQLKQELSNGAIPVSNASGVGNMEVPPDNSQIL